MPKGTQQVSTQHSDSAFRPLLLSIKHHRGLGYQRPLVAGLQYTLTDCLSDPQFSHLQNRVMALASLNVGPWTEGLWI